MSLKRIEQAVARLEAVASQPADSQSPDSAKLSEIEASNTRLREAIALSLREIDDLIIRHSADSKA
jgi:hypothetical protein